MVALYQRLISSGLSPHSAWRASFAIVPVPALLLVSILTLVFGTDHPAGKWSQRHQIPAAALVRRLDNHSGHPKITERETADPGNEDATVNEEKTSEMIEELSSDTDVAINEALTMTAAIQIIYSPLTWLPAFSYMASFGLELAIDANLTSVLYSLFHARDSAFGQTTAGYYTALFGLLNVFTRPLGGYMADAIYKTHGVPGKKWLTLGLSFCMGMVSIGLGRYIENHVQAQFPPSLAVIMILLTIIAIFCEMANGANFALVPHCNAYSNGVMSGIVGGMGNLGGIWFALLFRYQSVPIGKAFWIMGVVCMIFNLMVAWIPTPKW